MSYTDFRNIRATVTPSTGYGADGCGAQVLIFAETSDSNTAPRQWEERLICHGRKYAPWQLLPEKLYQLAYDAASGSIKLNGRTVSGSQFLAAFERVVYPKKARA